MSTQELKRPAEAKDRSLAETLELILATLHRSQQKGWVEVLFAIILSFATMGSAWCAYQSKRWAGEGGAMNGAASEAAQLASEDRLAAGDVRAMEVAVFLKIVEAKFEKKNELADFLVTRLPPQTRAVFDAWWATGPAENPDAPRSPFLMPQYKPALLEDARVQEQRARDFTVAAQAAARNSNTYVLLTVLFASVMFFGGISGTFESRRLRQIVLSIALVLFIVTFATLVMVPIAWS